MRAVRFLGPDQGVRLDPRTPEPALRPGEALIRPLRVAISQTDLELARGALGPDPLTLGHEFVGIVEKIEPTSDQASAARSLLGKRVVGAVNSVCGSCDLCRAGLRSHCRNRTVLGVSGRDGCFADRFTLPIMNLLAVPDAIDDDHAVFAEPIASAIHAAKQIRIEGKPYITILGDNAVGLLCAQIMTRLNASVRLLGESESRLDRCAKWGMKHRRFSEVGRRADQDVVVDCTGTCAGFDLATRLVRPRGTILLKGPLIPTSRTSNGIDLAAIAANEITVIGSRCGPLSEAIMHLEDGSIDVLSLISRRMKLDDAVDALNTAAQADQIKVLLDP